MQTSHETGARFEAAQALADHLRHHPEAFNTQPAELAERFNLDVEFVEEVLESLHDRKIPRRPRIESSFFKQTWSFLVKAFLGATSRPILFVTVSTLISLVIGFAILSGRAPSSASATAASSGFRVEATVGETSATVLILLTVLLHFAVYFRHGMSRYALYGGLVNWLILAPANIIVVFMNGKRISDLRMATTLLLVAFAFFMLCAIYTGLGVLVSVLGGYARIRRSESLESRLSRQDLLNRFFRVKEKLENNEGIPTRSTILDWPFAESFYKHPFLYSTVGGLAMGLIHVLVVGLITADLARRTSPAVGVAELFMFIVSILAMIAVGFFSRRPLYAAVGCVIFFLASRVPQMIPLGTYGWQDFVESVSPVSLVINCLLSALLGLLATIGAKVEERAAREQKLMQNDPAMLVAEMVRIQWQLSTSASDVTVIFVDVARSGEMKSSADPLAVEYSFREYQNLISQISEECGGSVQSTAGDGAVIAFDDPAAAFAASKRIQSAIEEFNWNVSRLSRPFRLRIGIHKGEVVGELSKVQHTEVIDIAAHVQTVAPVGGIAVTDDVAQALENESLIPLREPMDGHNVFIVLDPTSSA